MSRNRIRGRTADDIARSVEDAVRGGGFGPGQPLPPIRELATALRVSPVTVAAAYRRLQARGLVVASGRRGTRVRATPDPAPSPVESRSSPGTAGLIDLSSGSPDPALLPPLEAAWRSVDRTPSGYDGGVRSAPLLRFAAAEFAADGIPSDAIAVLGGGLDAIERLLREHLRPGDRVAVEDPNLPALLDLLGVSGYAAHPLALDAEGPEPAAVREALARGVRAVVVTARAQNPTGAALSRPRAEALARLLKARPDVLVIENDPAGPVAGVSLASLCGHGLPCWAAVRSVSKFLGPDLRLSVVAGDPRTMGRVEGRYRLGPRWVSGILQQLVVALWSDPSGGRWLARAADIYAQRRAALVEALAEHGITAAAPSGLNVWIPVREETATVQALAAHGWAVAAGERFRIGTGPGIRVTTAALDAEAARHFARDCAAAVRPSAAVSA